MVDIADSQTNSQIEIAGLREDYYHDSFRKLMLIIASMVAAIVLLLATSFYLYVSEPPPITFPVYKEWRIQQDIALDQPYLEAPILLQWVNDALRNVFHFDFLNYDAQLNEFGHYFTDDGWRVFLNQVHNYADHDEMIAKKQFINATPEGAPFITQQGVYLNRYIWWVQVPITLNYTGFNNSLSKTLTLQVLVVRVPTLNNLMGVAIDNIIVAQGTGALAGGNQ